MNKIGKINQLIGQLEGFRQTNMVSDEFHTFGELYQHRVTLYILLCRLLSEKGLYIWKSRLHDDDSMIEGMFVLGINIKHGDQITYHVGEQFWDSTEFAEVLEKSPAYDGHTPKDTLSRLNGLVLAL